MLLFQTMPSVQHECISCMFPFLSCCKGGPYHPFAGHDASRGLATFSLDTAKDEYDDLSDLNPMEMESVREWEMQFTGKPL